MQKTLDVYSIEGKVIGKVSLSPEVFDGKINKRLLWEVTDLQRKNQRRFQASTKTRAQVRGGGRKPWRQKGTGRARQGSIRAPQWRGAGVAFGPKPKDSYVTIPHKKKTKALQSSLNARVNEDNLIVLERLEIPSAKTKDFIKILRNLKIEQKVLFVDGNFEDSTKRSARNIPYLDLLPQNSLNPYEVLAHKKIVVGKDALASLQERIKKALNPDRKKGLRSERGER